jgi:hypothetical protein
MIWAGHVLVVRMKSLVISQMQITPYNPLKPSGYYQWRAVLFVVREAMLSNKRTDSN